jgi:hypothetical protein
MAMEAPQYQGDAANKFFHGFRLLQQDRRKSAAFANGNI